MKNVVIGIFDRDSANQAIGGLKALGYSDSDISVIVRNREEAERVHEESGTDATAADEAGKGMVTGGLVGALAGLLIGAGVIALPPLGISLAGPIAAALGVSGVTASTIAGAGVGAGIGGLAGLLSGLGLSEEEASTYERMVTEEHGVLLAVEARDDNSDEVEQVFVDNGAREIRTNLSTKETDRSMM